jgi:hypothetical protein
LSSNPSNNANPSGSWAGYTGQDFDTDQSTMKDIDFLGIHM